MFGGHVVKRFVKGLMVVSTLLFVGMKQKRKKQRETGRVPLKNGKTKAVYSFKKAIKEEVYVETEVDSNGSGQKDRVYVEITRPKETKKGLKVPVIYNMSPYKGEDKYPEYHHVDQDLYAGGPSSVHRGNYDAYFLSRGYGIVSANSIGTIHSDGCPTTGDEKEILAAKAVIDWLNGRATAFNKDGEPVVADWATGNVGMIGLSYEGTIPNGVATTGVEGLKTIVPIGAISNWYDYYRANGAVIAPGGYQGDDADRLARGVIDSDKYDTCACLLDAMEKDQDRVTGNYNHFWDQRNYLNKAENIQASVLLVHGLHDENVKRKQFSQWWEVLKEHQVPRKLWLHQEGHVDPRKVADDKWMDTLHKWFDYWLYHIQNGIMEEPSVTIQAQNRQWEDFPTWPHEDSVKQTIHLHVDEEDRGCLVEKHMEKKDLSVHIVDNPSIKAKELVKHPHVSSPHRAVFLSEILEEDVRLSGTPLVSLCTSFDQPVANLSVLLVDYGEEEPTIVTRGWMDPCNRNSITTSEKMIPHERYTCEWEMEPHDYVFKQGNRLGVVVLMTDYEYTKRPKSLPSMRLYPSQSQVILPVVGNIPTYL